jgi:hypothetical protein
MTRSRSLFAWPPACPHGALCWPVWRPEGLLGPLGAPGSAAAPVPIVALKWHKPPHAARRPRRHSDLSLAAAKP